MIYDEEKVETIWSDRHHEFLSSVNLIHGVFDFYIERLFFAILLPNIEAWACLVSEFVVPVNRGVGILPPKIMQKPQ